MALRFDNETHLRTALERRLHGPLDEQVWEALRDSGYVSDILRDENELPFSRLVDLYEDEERKAQRYRAGYEPAKPDKPAEPEGRQVRLPRRPPRPSAVEPIEQILALEAARREDVKAFRATVLGDRRLKNDVFETSPDGWTLERMKRAGLQAVPERSPEFLWQEGPFSTPEESRTVLSEYVSGQRAIAGRGRAAHELEYLWCLVDVLMNDYSWVDPVDVERFVLADEPPRLLDVSVAYMPGVSEAITGRYMFHASALTSPRELMRVYSDARSFMARTRHLPQRVRAAGSRKQELAVFVARHNEGRTWQEMMDLWNEQHTAPADADPLAGELTGLEKGRIERLVKGSEPKELAKLKAGDALLKRFVSPIPREEATAKILAERADGQRVFDTKDIFSDAGDFARRARDAYLTVMGRALDYAGEQPADDQEGDDHGD